MKYFKKEAISKTYVGNALANRAVKILGTPGATDYKLSSKTIKQMEDIYKKMGSNSPEPVLKFMRNGGNNFERNLAYTRADAGKLSPGLGSHMSTIMGNSYYENLGKPKSFQSIDIAKEIAKKYQMGSKAKEVLKQFG